mgnify:CR=1 FL=1
MDAVIINSALSWCIAALLGAVLVALKRLYSLILANQDGTKTLLRSSSTTSMSARSRRAIA